MTALQTELQDAKYIGLTDQQCLDLLTAKTIKIAQDIAVQDIQRYLLLNNKLLQIESASTPSALTAVRTLELFEVLDMEDATVVTAVTNILDGLISDGLIGVNDKVAILAIGEKLISTAEQLNLGHVRIGHIMEARK